MADVGKILNFHLPASDPARAVRFYSEVFGWTFSDRGDGTVPYFHATAEGTGIEAAIVQRNDIVARPVPTIEVEGIDDVMARLAVLGGQQSHVTTIEGIGRFGYAKDSEGNTIALLERRKPDGGRSDL